MRHRAWRLLHLLVVRLWLMSLLHGVGMGTDLGGGWWLVAVACAAARAAGCDVAARAAAARPARPTPNPPTTVGVIR